MDETNYLDIKGMHCAACVTRIEKTVSKIVGVTEVNVNLATEKARVTFHKNRTSLSDIIHKINTIGFEAKKSGKSNSLSNREKHSEIILLQWQFISSLLLTIPLAWSMFSHFKWSTFIYVPLLFTNPLFQLAITIPIQFIIGFQFYDNAWKALKSGSANMDVLVVLSTSAAFFYSHYLTMDMFFSVTKSGTPILYYETSAFIITFILLGRLLETKTKLKTTEAIKKLYQLQTKTATQYKDGKEVKTPIDRILPEDIILLKPGEKVPIDGQVLKGSSMINEALLTGESIPVEKKVGSLVYAGTINQNGVLQIHVTKRESETVLSQIIRVVEDAQASKAPIQHIADNITGIFVPIIIFIALTTFAFWYIILQPSDFSEALEKAIAVLIIACPCALGLATPTSVMVGSGRAAQFGILFKEGKYLEMLGRCKTVVFDKTGTLTKGTPHVTDIYVDQLDEKELLQLIGAVEKNSDHPIAKAITNEVKRKVSFFPHAYHVFSISGYGMKGLVNDKKIIIANPKYFIKSNHPLPPKANRLVTKLEDEGKTVIMVSIDDYFAGVIAVADELRPSSAIAVTRLKKMGLDIIMLTGDNKNSGVSVAKSIGINKVQTEVTPQDKADIIKQLQLAGNSVAMVGDGMNDAPALAVADVGIALGTGSDIAIESGDITIIKGDLNRFVNAIIISKKTMINIKQNLLWAFSYNFIMIPFAIIGFMAPWMAAAAMAFSSVTVVLNSLRLKQLKM